MEPTGQDRTELSVSELSGQIKHLIERAFTRVRIRAEVGRVARPGSGHIYLDLKDDRAVLAAVCWKGQATRLSILPEEGMEVTVIGRLTTFPGQSRYQLVVEDLRVAGVGALMAMLEQRKVQLAAEGLFAPDRKQPIPYLPEVIGVVTSPTGAVIRDILTTLQRRFPRRVLVWPVAVQGDSCAAQVANGITRLNGLAPESELPRPDLIIVARGGGSIEDLWGFNEEIVVRAAAASDIPLISAVGHETDTTLIDYVADWRAPTPTAAAELAVPRRDELLATLAAFEARRLHIMADRIVGRRQRLRDLGRALPRPQDIVARQAQQLDHLIVRLPNALTGRISGARARLGTGAGGLRPATMTRHISLCRDRLGPFGIRLAMARDSRLRRATDRLCALVRLHDTLGYQATLQRGYAIVRDSAGVVQPSAGRARAAPGLEIEFHDGRLAVRAVGAGKSGRVGPHGAGQGELF
ncbi:MAG: exodeoxyribonuclease VII large subunit [Rhodobacteraceae bacterium]|nr:exodeoxyribonuclease VII large subunit [Paracoccaceae bacterium]